MTATLRLIALQLYTGGDLFERVPLGVIDVKKSIQTPRREPTARRQQDTRKIKKEMTAGASEEDFRRRTFEVEQQETSWQQEQQELQQEKNHRNNRSRNRNDAALRQRQGPLKEPETAPWNKNPKRPSMVWLEGFHVFMFCLMFFDVL